MISLPWTTTRTVEADASRPDESATDYAAATAHADAEIAKAQGELAEAEAQLKRLDAQVVAYRELLEQAIADRDAKKAEFTAAFQTAMLRGQPEPSDSDLETAEARVRQVTRQVEAANAAVTAFGGTVEAARSRVRSAKGDKARVALSAEEQRYAAEKEQHETLVRSMKSRASRMDSLRFEIADLMSVRK